MWLYALTLVLPWQKCRLLSGSTCHQRCRTCKSRSEMKKKISYHQYVKICMGCEHIASANTCLVSSQFQNNLVIIKIRRWKISYLGVNFRDILNAVVIEYVALYHLGCMIRIGWSGYIKYKRGNYLHKNIKYLSKEKILRMKTIENFQDIKRNFEKKRRRRN